MLRIFRFVFFILAAFINLSNLAMASEISLKVVGKASDVNAEMNEEQVLLLNGLRQAVTQELLNLKLNSDLYWSKLEKKKMTPKEEMAYLEVFFKDEVISRAAPTDPKLELPLEGTFSASSDLEKLKINYEEIIADLGDTKLKTLYILGSIEIDESMTWEDTGVTKSENFTSVILDSWKKLFEKELKGFENVVILAKDFATKPEYMNPKSSSLKWKSILKKTASAGISNKVTYELSAQYVLQNTKSGTVLTALDFPVQKRILDPSNKKELSSSLASLIYNLLNSQVSKINALLEADAKALTMSEIDIKIVGKVGLSDIFKINNFLQEKFKELKLTSQMKSYSSDSAWITLRAEGTIEAIVDSLSKEGGKFPLNEQNILLFNRADKTFAILPKESNN